MPFDWSNGALAEGLNCYKCGQYFEAHEHWEAVWLECVDPDKTFLQAMIQVTAAFHHLKRGNRIGTASLLRRALRRLEGFPEEYGGVAVLPLRTSIHDWVAALDTVNTQPVLPLPKIR
jgi:uncharacterized protein